MEAKRQHLVGASFLRNIGIILFLGYCSIITPVEAAVTGRSFNGTVEVLFEGEQIWNPFSDTMKLNVGDQIRTGRGSSVDLVCEDESELHIAEETQIAISELEFSVTEKTCVSRFKLFGGIVTAKVATFTSTSKKNAFKIDTDTVVVDVKSSEGTITALKDEPGSDVIVKQGLFEIQQTGKGIVNISGLVDDHEGDQEGLAFPLDSLGAWIYLDVQKDKRKITLESNVPLPSIRALIGNHDNILEVKNVSDALLNVSSQGNAVILDREERAIFEVPADQEIFIEATGKANAIFWFRRISFPKTQSPRKRYSPALAPKQTIESSPLPE